MNGGGQPWVPLSYRIARRLDGELTCTRTEARKLEPIRPYSFGCGGDRAGGEALAAVLLADFLRRSPCDPEMRRLRRSFREQWLSGLELSWGQSTSISSVQLEEWASELHGGSDRVVAAEGASLSILCQRR